LAAGITHYLLKFRLTHLCYYILRLYLSLIRVRVIGEDSAGRHFAEYGRAVAAIWHQRFLPALAYVTKFRSLKPIVMISKSRDGELVAKIAERLGLITVRGSSSRGGREALRAVLTALNKNPAVVHIVDGPQGPKGVVKPGLIMLAQVSRAVILPVIVSAEKAWVAGSWDQFLIPKPFSTVTIRWEEPFLVPRRLNKEQLERLRGEIEKRLTAAYAKADLEAGWKQPL
jgi:lysophospholipid acyltransferase (LPLAT)-like uncharacterized protein